MLSLPPTSRQKGQEKSKSKACEPTKSTKEAANIIWLMKKVSLETSHITSDLIRSFFTAELTVKYNTDIFLQKTLTAGKYLNSSFLKAAGDSQKRRQS